MLASGAIRVGPAGVAVGGVVPGRAADARAVALLVDDVELGQQVDALGDQVALVEAVGAFVGDRRVADLGVARFDARGEVQRARVLSQRIARSGLPVSISKACAPLLRQRQSGGYGKGEGANARLERLRGFMV